MWGFYWLLLKISRVDFIAHSLSRLMKAPPCLQFWAAPSSQSACGSPVKLITNSRTLLASSQVLGLWLQWAAAEILLEVYSRWCMPPSPFPSHIAWHSIFLPPPGIPSSPSPSCHPPSQHKVKGPLIYMQIYFCPRKHSSIHFPPRPLPLPHPLHLQPASPP